MKKVTESIFYIGVDDTDIDLFESQYVVPDGMCYNSYVIVDEKVAIMDTVDKRKGAEWLDNVKEALGERRVDYLVIQHMEPDHSGTIAQFMELYPEVTLVGNAKTFAMLKAFTDIEPQNKLEISEGDTLSLGTHTLTFIMAPMVHWPEVFVTYDSTDKVLFSADGFGKFGVIDADKDDWTCEARRYYFNICGKYGAQVQALLKKAAMLEIEKILPLHGPMLEDNLGFYIDKYDVWSRYAAESEGVFIAYGSIHGNTAVAAKQLAEMIEKKGTKVVLTDLSRSDLHEAVEDAFRYDRMIVACPTYDAGLFPVVQDFIHHLKSKAYQNRRVGLMENGSWAPVAAKRMTELFAEMKNVEIVAPVVTIRSAMKSADIEVMKQLADTI